MSKPDLRFDQSIDIDLTTELNLHALARQSAEAFVLNTIAETSLRTISDVLLQNNELQARVLSQIASEENPNKPDKEELQGLGVFIARRVLGNIGPSLMLRFEDNDNPFNAEVLTLCSSIVEATRMELACWAANDREALHRLQTMRGELELHPEKVTEDQRMKISSLLLRKAAERVLHIPGQEQYDRVRRGTFTTNVTLDQFGTGYTEKVLPPAAYEIGIDQNRLQEFSHITGTSGLFFNGFYENPEGKGGFKLPSEEESLKEYLTWRSRDGEPEYTMCGWQDENGELVAAHSSHHATKNPSDHFLEYIRKCARTGETGYLAYTKVAQRHHIEINPGRIEKVGITYSRAPYAAAFTWERWSEWILEDNPSIDRVIAFILHSLDFLPPKKHQKPAHLEVENLGGNDAIYRFIQPRGFRRYAHDNHNEGPVSIRAIHGQPWRVRPYWDWYSVDPRLLRDRCRYIRIHIDKKFANFPQSVGAA